MALEIRSHIEYLIQTYHILLIFVDIIEEKSSLNGGF